ncbi:MAG: hypothetical protein K9H16_09705 [Bacteroidales bacterium]|nr:hypothetical protein [Bacteroidales bacterium]
MMKQKRHEISWRFWFALHANYSSLDKYGMYHYIPYLHSPMFTYFTAS